MKKEKNMQDVQAKFDLTVLVSPTSWNASFSRSCPELVESKAKSTAANASVTYLTIPEVNRGVANIRSFLETYCLLKNPLGQYVCSEAVLEKAVQRLNTINEDIQKAVEKLLNEYDTRKDEFRGQLEEYMTHQLGKTTGRKVASSLMTYYPTKQAISGAAVALRLDYVAGSGSLSPTTVKMVEESKTQELALNYQNMVRRAVEPMYQKLGQLVNQAVTDKMSERTLTAYRKAIIALKEDNAILCNPALDELALCGPKAINDSDYAELLMVNIFRLADLAGVSQELPAIPRYDYSLLSTLAKDDTVPLLGEMAVRIRKAMSEEVDA